MRIHPLGPPTHWLRPTASLGLLPDADSVNGIESTSAPRSRTVPAQISSCQVFTLPWMPVTICPSLSEMSSDHQVHALGAEQLVTAKREAGSAALIKGIACAGAATKRSAWIYSSGVDDCVLQACSVGVAPFEDPRRRSRRSACKGTCYLTPSDYARLLSDWQERLPSPSNSRPGLTLAHCSETSHQDTLSADRAEHTWRGEEGNQRQEDA